LCRDFWVQLPLENMARYLVGGALMVAALALDIIAFWEFRKFKTTVNPINPDKASLIVASGIFSKTRNPMYLGMILLLSGWAILNTSLLGFLLVFGFWAFITRFQIIPEERALSAKFGQGYLDYLSKVRRWI
ncbi:MAG: isoprenylcysteine carboxylmethyltransferase family protein, partial [Pseudomonadota bacterium]